ncbi:two-component regulator propeller domain-containing protein [Mediterranea massiliensis]|nr:two-component regulator propeller domain-containing protein [Mediterranea massiliensis]MDM8336005.1 two-component regulator propeller domain-containing protein [Mediterranea massiliensis]
MTISNPLITNNISNQRVNAFAEDAQGHIWIGTFRGLNKYNVHEFHQYFCTDDSLDLPDNQIKDMLRDSKGRLWISTVNGVCRYTDKDNFKHIPSDMTNKNGIQLLEGTDGRIFLNYTSHLSVYNPTTEEMNCVIPQLDPQGTMIVKCFIDAEAQLWVVTPRTLRCYDYYSMQLKDSVAINKNSRYFYLHKDGKIWLTGSRTLLLFDTHTHQFTDLPPALAQHSVLREAEITYIHPYGNNSLLLNTSRHGMFCYNYANNTIAHQGDEDFPFEVPEFQISCMFTDSQNNLWIGSTDQGYTVCYHYKERFNNDNYIRSYFNNKSVVSASAEKNGILWITTLSDGVYRYDLNNKKVVPIDMEKIFPESRQKAVRVNQIFVDNDNNLWITVTNNKVLKCQYSNNDLHIINEYDIKYPMSITQDYKGSIWIGTASPYVYKIAPEEKVFREITAFDISTGSNFTFIPGLLAMKDGNLLVAAFNKPMQLINTQTEAVKELLLNKEDYKACIKRSVIIPTALYEDMQGDIWIGTVSNGLLRYSPSNGKIQPMPGTACTDISGIEEDTQGNLWVSTLYGLSRYDRTTNRFTNYYEADGIGGNQFYDRASCRLSDGTLVFGGTHGLTLFNPIDVQIRRNIPLLFENLKVHNKLIHPGNEECINKHLSYNPDIKLNYNQNGFSISFVALDYSEHERVHYYYMLEGFDRYWIDANNNREAYYANLPAGCYTFKVRIMDNDRNIVEAENSITVTVEPAPWRTWWAYTLYLLLAVGVVFLFLRALYRIRLEKEQARRAEQEKEQEQRVNKMNMSFFANVSHEFRTPLTMISGPVAQLCESPEIDGNNKKLLHIVQQSVNRMLRLVNQLMDFNKLENDTLKLKVKRTDVVTELKRIMEIFNVNAQSKDISLITTGIEDSFLMWLDADKIDKITTNLLSNALKFTPRGGKIEVNFDVITGEEARQAFRIPQEQTFAQYIKLEVADTGIGIPEEQTERIFERYYQLNNQSVGSYNWGTGIGLYYARSLAHLHHGLLKAGNRTDGQGAVFTLILPTSDEAYRPEERDNEQQEQGKVYPLQPDSPTGTSTHDEEEEDDNLKKILVVDDDTEVAHYLKVLLSPAYRVICRFNAEDAFKAVSEEAPDLVLSDVVMPGTDGYTLCRKIKEDLQLCHTPVILVTAKANMEDQVEGLNTGADAYVTKPFDPTYLQALIQSQLKNREKVRALLGRNTQTDAIADDVLSPQDNAFMTELYRLMENELSNPELDISHMTELLKISRTKFYYKVKGLTGENPSSFFKTYKLNRAAELIKEGKYSISEIADMTGFSTHSYFSKAFKKQFGIAPSEYK